MEQTLKKALAAALLVLIALISALFVAEKASTPANYEKTIASIDEKTETVLTLTAASTLASAGISAIPGDTATPIAEKLADFTEYFLLILSVLYCEKYLLTIIGAGVFRFLVPLICALLIGSLYLPFKSVPKLAVKFLIFGVALYSLIPVSIGVSDMIYDTYQNSIDSVVSSAGSLTEETSALSEYGEAEESGFLGALTEKASQLTTKAASILKQFVETLAVLIVTSCLIPILTLVFFLWLVKQLTGMDLNLKLPGHNGEVRRNRNREHPEE